MTISKMNTLSKRSVTGILAAVLLIAASSCAKKNTAVNKTEPVAAETPAIPVTIMEPEKGKVQILRDVNSNYVIHINLSQLEEISKIEPTSKKAYIVWMNTEAGLQQNLGQINSNTAWLSDRSKAKFEATSAIKPTKIYITEEDMVTVKTPGSKLIWSTNSF